MCLALYWATGMNDVRMPTLPTPGERKTGKQCDRYNDRRAPSPCPDGDRGRLRKQPDGGDPEPSHEGQRVTESAKRAELRRVRLLLRSGGTGSAGAGVHKTGVPGKELLFYHKDHSRLTSTLEKDLSDCSRRGVEGWQGARRLEAGKAGVSEGEESHTLGGWRELVKGYRWRVG